MITRSKTINIYETRREKRWGLDKKDESEWPQRHTKGARAEEEERRGEEGNVCRRGE